MARIQLFNVASNPKQGAPKKKMSPKKKAELVARLQAGRKKAARKAGKTSPKKAVKKVIAKKKNPQRAVYMHTKGKSKKEVYGKAYPTVNEMTFVQKELARKTKELAALKKGKGSLEKSMNLSSQVSAQNAKLREMKDQIMEQKKDLARKIKQGFQKVTVQRAETAEGKADEIAKDKASQAASERRNKKRKSKQKSNNNKKANKKANKQGVSVVAKKRTKKVGRKSGKKSAKKVVSKKVAPKKARRKVARKSAAPKKARKKASRKGRGNRKQVIHLRGKKSVMVKVLKNPSVKGLTGQDSMMELAGLAIGGAGYNLFNDLGKKYLPASVANIIAKAGPVSGAVIPTLVGFGLLKLAEKKGMKKVAGVAKGIIAAAIVAVGASFYEVAARKYVVGTLPAPMKGYDDEDMGQVSYEDFGATVQEEFGEVSANDFSGSDEFSEGDFSSEF